MNVISYSLYGTHRLYWQNIPFLIIANDILFPGFRQRFFIHRDSASILIYDVLQACHEAGRIDVVKYDGEIGKAPLKLRRMSPLWDGSTEYLFPRDLDSVPMSHEVRAVKVFMDSGLAVHMFRGHEQHSTLMAGLSGFRRHSLKGVLPSTFDDFCSRSRSITDDQVVLRETFLKRPMKQIMETPVCGAKRLSWSCAVQTSQSSLDGVDLSFVPSEFLAKMDRDAVFPGAVMHVSKETFRLALAMGTDLASIVGATLSGSRLDDYLSPLREKG